MLKDREIENVHFRLITSIDFFSVAQGLNGTFRIIFALLERTYVNKELPKRAEYI